MHPPPHRLLQPTHTREEHHSPGLAKRLNHLVWRPLELCRDLRVASLGVGQARLLLVLRVVVREVVLVRDRERLHLHHRRAQETQTAKANAKGSQQPALTTAQSSRDGVAPRDRETHLDVHAGAHWGAALDGAVVRRLDGRPAADRRGAEAVAGARAVDGGSGGRGRGGSGRGSGSGGTEGGAGGGGGEGGRGARPEVSGLDNDRENARDDVQDFGALVREVRQPAHRAAGHDLHGRLVRSDLWFQAGRQAGAPRDAGYAMRGRVEGWTRTVEKMAAGTLKMTLMIAFRFNRMNTTASRLEKNLCVYAHVPVSGD